MSGVLSKADIRRLTKEMPPLIECYIDLETQLQPNGFDLTLRDISMLCSPGLIGTEKRAVSATTPLVFDNNGFINLIPSVYMITYNEVVNLPTNIMALGRPRSSLLRCGVTIGTAVWDAGYSGRSQSMLVVYNPLGIKLQKDARVAQLIFMELTGRTEGYHGVYQRENIQ